jgi:hypothetical protein
MPSDIVFPNRETTWTSEDSATASDWHVDHVCRFSFSDFGYAYWHLGFIIDWNNLADEVALKK